MSREPRAVLILLSLAVLGHGARLLLQSPSAAPGELLAVSTSSSVDPARQRARAEHVARPLGSGERIDINAAPAEEIARLPRVGMSLAKRIVADRIARGPYRALADLDRVSGVGPALLGLIAERLRFGGVEGVNANTRTSETYSGSPPVAGGTPVELNSASEADLVALPGIGRARARAILAYRRENGPFAVVSDLGRVPGFSHSLVIRLTPFVVVK